MHWHQPANTLVEKKVYKPTMLGCHEIDHQADGLIKYRRLKKSAEF